MKPNGMYHWIVEWREASWHASMPWIRCLCACEGLKPLPYYTSTPRENIGFTTREQARDYCRCRKAMDKTDPYLTKAIYHVRRVEVLVP